MRALSILTLGCTGVGATAATLVAVSLASPTPRPTAPVSWTVRGTADDGRILRIAPTGTGGLCDHYQATILGQEPGKPIALSLGHWTDPACDAGPHVRVGFAPPVITVRLAAALAGRAIGGPKFRAADPLPADRAKGRVLLFTLDGSVPDTVGMSVAQATAFWEARGIVPQVTGPETGDAYVQGQTPAGATPLLAPRGTKQSDITSFARSRGYLAADGRLRITLQATRPVAG